MNVLYVRENVDKPNWGARATSMALREIIASQHAIIGAVRSGPMGRWYRDAHHTSPALYDRVCAILDREKVKAAPGIGAAARAVMAGLGVPRGMGHDLDENARLIARAGEHVPEVARVLKDLKRSDALMMNLEGDGIFPEQPRRHLLFFLTLAHLAKRQGKGVYILNGMLSPDPRNGINSETLEVARGVFEAADLLVLREQASKRFQEAHMPAANAFMRPDAVFTWRDRFADDSAGERYDPSALWPFFDRSPVAMPAVLDKPYAVVGGSSSAQWANGTAPVAYRALVTALKKLGLGVVIVESCHGDSFLHGVAKATDTPIIPVDVPISAAVALLANARVFVSGRWHPSIMASLNGTPSVFLGSNSHKTLSIQEQLSYPDPHEYPVVPNAGEIDAIVAEAEDLLKGGASVRQRIAAASAHLAADAASVKALL